MLIPGEILYLFKTKNYLFNFKHCLNLFFNNYLNVPFYNIFKNKKKFKKYSYTSNFILFNSNNIIPKTTYFMFLNKFFCFWPLKSFDSNMKKLLIKLIKKQKQKTYKGFQAILTNFLKLNKIKHLNLKIQKNNKIKKKSYFCNMHKKQIKIFWKSQNFFKQNFLKKIKFTTRKFKNKFTYWYRKNKKSDKNLNATLYSIIVNNFLFYSGNQLHKIFKNALVVKNGICCVDSFQKVFFGDILTIPLNYSKFLLGTLIGQKNSFKRLKKKNYIYIKNKLSQWKSIKKKQTTELLYNLVFFNKIKSQIEFDLFSSSLCFVKDSKFWDRFLNFTPRHNLEKLNTYKLNV